jgi:hypothetical protein
MTTIDVVSGLLRPGGLRAGKPQSAGSLTVVPVFHDGPPLVYVTLAEGVAAGTVRVEEVSEGGSVGSLRVVNRGSVPVLLVEGEVLAGLKQTRTLTTTVLVAANTVTVIPVACVEQGRWSYRSTAAAPDDYFVSPGVRHPKSRSVQATVRARGDYAADQGAVWSSVEERLVRHRAPAPTRSYDEVGRHRGVEIEAGIAALRPEPGQQGVLALIGRHPVACDLFDRPETLRALWRALVGSYYADALVEGRPAEERHVKEALDRLHTLAEGRATVHPAVGLGEVVQVSAGGAVASALVADGAVVHLAALWPEQQDRPEPRVRMQRPSGRQRWFHEESSR